MRILVQKKIRNIQDERYERKIEKNPAKQFFFRSYCTERAYDAAHSGYEQKKRRERKPERYLQHESGRCVRAVGRKGKREK